MRGPRITAENLANQVDVVNEEIRVNVLNRPYGGFPWIELPPVLFDTFANAHNGYGDFVDLEAATVADCADFFERYYTAGQRGAHRLRRLRLGPRRRAGAAALRRRAVPAGAGPTVVRRAVADLGPPRPDAPIRSRRRRRWPSAGGCRIRWPTCLGTSPTCCWAGAVGRRIVAAAVGAGGRSGAGHRGVVRPGDHGRSAGRPRPGRLRAGCHPPAGRARRTPSSTWRTSRSPPGGRRARRRTRCLPPARGSPRRCTGRTTPSVPGPGRWGRWNCCTEGPSCSARSLPWSPTSAGAGGRRGTVARPGRAAQS